MWTEFSILGLIWRSSGLIASFTVSRVKVECQFFFNRQAYSGKLNYNCLTLHGKKKRNSLLERKLNGRFCLSCYFLILLNLVYQISLNFIHTLKKVLSKKLWITCWLLQPLSSRLSQDVLVLGLLLSCCVPYTARVEHFEVELSSSVFC